MRLKCVLHRRVHTSLTVGDTLLPTVDSIWIASKPKLFWVTSRQAPTTIWVDAATERAIYAFRQRDTSGYPHQTYLDHGDLVDAYREGYENKTLPAECIGRKGAGGHYFPTADCIVLYVPNKFTRNPSLQTKDKHS